MDHYADRMLRKAALRVAANSMRRQMDEKAEQERALARLRQHRREKMRRAIAGYTLLVLIIAAVAWLVS